jgi:hypothetical protein
MSDLLQRGIELARAGQREQARTTLLQLVEADETNEMGWLWLSGVMDAAEDIRVCLENVLEINPENQQARQGIEWLNSRYTIPTAPEPEPNPEPAVHVSVPVAPAPIAAPVAAVSDTPTVEPETPCPYCGSPTALSQRNCLSCKNSLMIRSDPPAKRSAWLSLLAGLRLLDASLTALAACAVFAVAISAYQAWQVMITELAGATRSNPAIPIATIGVVILIWAGLSLSIGRGLLRRLRWAYYATIVLAVVSLIVALIQFVASQAVLATLNSTAAQSGGSPITPELVSSIASGWLVFGLVLQGLYIALIVASFRDFYGPLLRFAPEVKRIDHATNYNNGVAYKNRGMWYMAMREWELAVSRAPQNTTYLHALGLAYAQVGRFSRARATLDHALDLAPGNAQMAESRTLIEKMAAAQKG